MFGVAFYLENINMQGLLMKKLVGTLILTSTLLLSTQVLSAEASGVETNMTPNKISAKSGSLHTITVSTNVGGTNYIRFAETADANWRGGYSNYTRNFSQRWWSNTITNYTYRGQVTSETYGPGPVSYGTATISY